MADPRKLAQWLDLQNNPFGANPNDPNPQVPANFVMPPARVYIVNHSAKVAWKRVAVPVSFRRGAEEALIYDKKLAEIYNVDTLQRRAETQNMSRYESGVKPVVLSFKCGGQTYAIPPARDEKSEPPRVEVREGAWDLFLGNYDRMRSKDLNTVENEKVKLALYWSSRHNPVMAYTDDGATHKIDNPYGFLEFVRETVRMAPVPVDKEYLSALDLMET